MQCRIRGANVKLLAANLRHQLLLRKTYYIEHRMDVLPDSVLEQILSYADLRTRISSEAVSRRWRVKTLELWRKDRRLTFYELFEDYELPIGRELNRALHWALLRCAPSLSILNLSDLSPINRVFRVNARTFKIIGHYCKELQELYACCQSLLSEHLLSLCDHVDLSQLRVANFAGAFCHHCAIGTGLARFYDSCPRLELINLSRSVQTRVPDCEEKWPSTLKHVYVDDASSLTGYSICSLTRCAPQLETFSLSTDGHGLECGLDFALTRLPMLKKLQLRGFRGDPKLGCKIGLLQHLQELYLGHSWFVMDTVLLCIAVNCPLLRVLDLSLTASDSEDQSGRHGRFTESGMMAIGLNLPNLIDLRIAYRNYVCGDGLTFVCNRLSLQRLTVSGCDWLSPAVLLDVVGVSTELQFLDITDTSVTDLRQVSLVWRDVSTVRHIKLVSNNMRILQFPTSAYARYTSHSGYDMVSNCLPRIVISVSAEPE